MRQSSRPCELAREHVSGVAEILADMRQGGDRARPHGSGSRPIGRRARRARPSRAEGGPASRDCSLSLPPEERLRWSSQARTCGSPMRSRSSRTFGGGSAAAGAEPPARRPSPAKKRAEQSPNARSAAPNGQEMPHDPVFLSRPFRKGQPCISRVSCAEKPPPCKGLPRGCRSAEPELPAKALDEARRRESHRE